MKKSPALLFIFLLLISSSILFHRATSKGSIIFSTQGRSLYRFDIFTVPITSTHPSVTLNPAAELKLTDGVSLNYNGHFPSNASNSLLYISERRGAFSIYLTSFNSPSPFTFPLLPPSISLKDRPSLSGDRLIYVSTHQPSGSPRWSWAAVYSTHLPTATTTRLTPPGLADFSPSVSPSGDWTAVASSGDRGWDGEVQELSTSIYVFRTADGSARTKLVEHGGWPCWADDTTLYFHRQSEDGWWSVYRVVVQMSDGGRPVAAWVDRVTPPGFHAFTPAASTAAPGIIAVATRRGDSIFRHVELVDLRGGLNAAAFLEVTRPVAPSSNHYNPFLSGTSVGYHRCRGGASENGGPQLQIENLVSPSPDEYSLFRFDGTFPTFSPDGEKIAFVGFGSGWDDNGLYVVNSNRLGEPIKILESGAFYTAWDWKKKGVFYTSLGQQFGSLKTEVDVVSVTVSDDPTAKPIIKKLTLPGENNAFPSPSPDGKRIVFRSGRSGHKNLYIMDAEKGESGGLFRLTEGPWTDTMCTWSPDGEWIAFDSDRDDPGGNSFSIYAVHPNGTGLRRVFRSGDGGRADHSWFSPDSKRIVFTADYAGVSAEPVSLPHHFQPYGEIFTVGIDGSDVRRVTHNSYEDGTATWTPFALKEDDVAEAKPASLCKIGDCFWLSPVSGVTATGVQTAAAC